MELEKLSFDRPKLNPKKSRVKYGVAGLFCVLVAIFFYAKDDLKLTSEQSQEVKSDENLPTKDARPTPSTHNQNNHPPFAKNKPDLLEMEIIPNARETFVADSVTELIDWLGEYFQEISAENVNSSTIVNHLLQKKAIELIIHITNNNELLALVKIKFSYSTDFSFPGFPNVRKFCRNFSSSNKVSFTISLRSN